MAQSSPAVSLWLAANNGDIGGGEVMLLRTAEMVRQLGVTVGIVAPDQPDGVAAAAGRAGFPVAALAAGHRRRWMTSLRRWDRKRWSPEAVGRNDPSDGADRTAVLWCHGLVPALATAGHPDRIVHLHQLPQGRVQRLLAPLATWRTEATLVPSRWMASQLPGTSVLENWTEAMEQTPSQRSGVGPVIGFLGRPSISKGVDVLAEAVALLEQRGHIGVRLVVAGEARFVSSAQRDLTEKALAAIAPLTERPGWLAREDLFARVDVVVMPSRAPESFGLAAAEAMAASTPVVVSDAGALPEVVGAPEGLVVPAGDPAALADVLEQLARGTAADGVDQRRARWQHQYSPEAGKARVAEVLQRIGLMDTAGRTPQ